MGLMEFPGGEPIVTDDHALAAELAETAGQVLLALRADQDFADTRMLMDTGDRRAHDHLMAALARHRPGDEVLSEEGPKDRVDLARLDADRVWIIDPLDGTREFGEEGRGDWAVHVALWEARRAEPRDNGKDAPRAVGGPQGRLRAGAVALPAQGKTLVTTEGGGAEVIDQITCTRSPLIMPDLADARRIRVAVSRSRPPDLLRHLVAYLDARGVAADLVPIGSAGAKISAVLFGEVDAYVHAGGQYEWDSAAPAAVALAAGAHASRIDGAELAYNQKDPALPDILVCHPEWASTLLAGIRDATHAC